MKKGYRILSILLIVSLLAGFVPNTASAADPVTVTDQNGLIAQINAGAQNIILVPPEGNVILITSNITIPAGTTLTIENSGYSITNNAVFTNNGIVINRHTFFRNFQNFTNNGVITNDGKIYNDDTASVLTNSATGTITNNGTLYNTKLFNNAGTFTNNNNFSNSGTFNDTGVLTDDKKVELTYNGVTSTYATVQEAFYAVNVTGCTVHLLDDVLIDGNLTPPIVGCVVSGSNGAGMNHSLTINNGSFIPQVSMEFQDILVNHIGTGSILSNQRDLTVGGTVSIPSLTAATLTVNQDADLTANNISAGNILLNQGSSITASSITVPTLSLSDNSEVYVAPGGKLTVSNQLISNGTGEKKIILPMPVLQSSTTYSMNLSGSTTVLGSKPITIQPAPGVTFGNDTKLIYVGTNANVSPEKFTYSNALQVLTKKLLDGSYYLTLKDASYPTSITIDPITNRTYGDTAVISAEISKLSNGTPANTGTAKFYSGTTVNESNLLKTVAVDAIGQAECALTVSDLPAGNQSFLVVFEDVSDTFVSSQATINVTVVPKMLTVSGVNVSDKVYDGTTAALYTGTPVLNGVINGENVLLINGMPSFASQDASQNSIPVNFSNFSIVGEDSVNYVLAQPTLVTAHINKAILTASTNNVLMDAGDALPNFQVSVTGFVNGEDSELTGYVAPSVSHAVDTTVIGDYPLTLSGGNPTNNYQFDYVPNSILTVMRRTPALSMEANPVSPATYPNQIVLSASLSNLCGAQMGRTIEFNIDGNTVTATTNASGIASYTFTPSTAKTYSISASYDGDANHNSASSSAISYQVNKGTQAALSITNAPATVIYGEGNFSLATEGGSGTGGVTYVSSDETVLNVNETTGEVSLVGVGGATITATKASDTNYNSTSADVFITVNKGPQTALFIHNVPTSVVYGSGKFTVSTTGGSGNGEVTYSSSDSNVLAVDATSGEVTVVGLGTAVITATKASDSNYSSKSATVSITVAKGVQTTLSITNVPTAVTYGDNHFTLAITGGSGTGEETYSSSNQEVLSVDETSGDVTVIGAGTAEITVTKAADESYTSASKTTTITVNPKELTLTNLAVKGKSYDGTTTAEFISTPQLNGIEAGDEVTLICGEPSFVNKNASADKVDVHFTNFSMSGTNVANYNLIQPGTVSASIDKATLYASTNNASILAGDTLPSFPVVVTGFVNGEGDSLAGYVKPTVTHAMTDTTIVGEYPLTISGGNPTANYIFIYQTGTKLTIGTKVNAEKPTFNPNLSGETTYAKNEAATKLVVNATVSDGGTLTYQWYSDTKNGTTGGTKISGATSETITPSTNQAGTTYYYVITTNTNQSVNGIKTATATSGVKKITVNEVTILPTKAEEDTPVTTIQGETDQIKEAVLTEADKEKLAKGSTIEISLHSKMMQVAEADKTVITAMLDGKEIGFYLDLSLIKNIDGVEEKVSQLSSPIRITIDIPVAYRATNRAFTIVRVHNGVATELVDLDNDPNTITFETDQFSTYALAYKDAATKEAVSDKEEAVSDKEDAVAEKLPKTGDGTKESSKAGENMPILPLGVVMMAGLCMMLVEWKKKVIEK